MLECGGAHGLCNSGPIAPCCHRTPCIVEQAPAHRKPAPMGRRKRPGSFSAGSSRILSGISRAFRGSTVSRNPRVHSFAVSFDTSNYASGVETTFRGARHFLRHGRCMCMYAWHDGHAWELHHEFQHQGAGSAASGSSPASTRPPARPPGSSAASGGLQLASRRRHRRLGPETP